jgi:C4-dicarboxylate-specific signal transduction histidine kinase
MLYALDEIGTATAFVKKYPPNPAPRVIGLGAADTPAADGQVRYHETQTELAHANRVAMLGQLSASIAHELNQPISAVVINAQTALRLLNVQPANMAAIRQALNSIVKDGLRAGDIVDRTRSLIKKAPPRQECLEINAAVLEAIDVTHHELVANGVTVQMKLAKDLPLIQGDRVQLQQVMLNLIINAIEAMSSQAAGARDLVIRTARTTSNGVLVAVQDCGPGMDPANLERVFDPFFTTKADGLGMGLSICRAIIQTHGGRLWATREAPQSALQGALQGTTLQFTLPAGTDNALK